MLCLWVEFPPIFEKRSSAALECVFDAGCACPLSFFSLNWWGTCFSRVRFCHSLNDQTIKRSITVTCLTNLSTRPWNAQHLANSRPICGVKAGVTPVCCTFVLWSMRPVDPVWDVYFSNHVLLLRQPSWSKRIATRLMCEPIFHFPSQSWAKVVPQCWYCAGGPWSQLINYSWLNLALA